MRPRGREQRRATYRRGRWAELAALVLLSLKGYRVIARRYAAGGGEIDLIIARGEVVAFVEVKGRALIDEAAGAIGARKRARIARAVRAWLARHPWALGRILRADAVFVAPGRLPRHVPAAFEIDLD